MSAFSPRPYAPRPMRFLGVEDWDDGWRVKRYSVAETNGAFDAARFT